MTVDDHLAAFCETHHVRLVGMVALLVGDRFVAEELAQEALARLCQHWPRVREMQHPDRWLNSVAMNLGRSWFRRRAAQQRALARHGESPRVSERDDATTVAVREAVAQLPHRQRSAVIYRFYLGYSVRETAETMGCAEGTVKAHTFRALATLRGLGFVPAGSTTDEERAVEHSAVVAREGTT